MEDKNELLSADLLFLFYTHIQPRTCVFNPAHNLVLNPLYLILSLILYSTRNITGTFNC